MSPFELARPRTLAEAAAAFQGDAAWLAGGHTLIPAMKSRLRTVETLWTCPPFPASTQSPWKARTCGWAPWRGMGR